ncbi:transglycosylase family protein [Streptomyces sp. NPDC058872]|uniref:transglycosylase family protein n=1 Tax=Streptomyces sp. NPDC058872 TaxID=3346661 RepID=UPI0036D1AC74
MALPLLATGSASAADAATWDRVAECESGGQWSANFGNGMYGGLQFTQDSWERNGGLAYAPSPDLASRAQQIAVAEKALAGGSNDWATCAPIAGLKNDGKATGVNPGPAVTPAAPTGPPPESNRTGGEPVSSAGGQGATQQPAAPVTPSAPATSATPTHPTTPAYPTIPSTPDASVNPDGSTAPVDPTAPTAPDASITPDVSVSPGIPEGEVPSATPGTGKHRGEAAPEESGMPGNSSDAGRHASGVSGGDVQSATDGAKASAEKDSKGTSGEYTVRPGDSLSDIAQENELPGGWTALYDANRQTVGTDPDLILPGQSLDLTADPVAAEG